VSCNTADPVKSTGPTCWVEADSEAQRVSNFKNTNKDTSLKILFLIIAGIWYLLQVYILPKLGVSTGVRKSCQKTGNKGKLEEKIAEKSKEKDSKKLR